MTRQVSVRHAAVTSKPFSRKRFRKVLHREIHELSSSSCLTFLVAARQRSWSVSSSKAIERMELIPSIDEPVDQRAICGHATCRSLRD
jgi:hypothetical protein